MNEYAKHSSPRLDLRERIVDVALNLFAADGIKGITMDDIAASLGISKRTLYEVFSDKESLLMACVLKGQADNDAFIAGVVEKTNNVLEILLQCYQRTIERFHATNKKFFEDIRKYPKVYEMVKNNHNRSSEDSINFFKEGIRQGFFREDVNFAILNVLVRGQLDMLMNTDLCNRYPFLEVYEAIMFTFLRGVSTHKGVAELEKFIADRHKKKLVAV